MEESFFALHETVTAKGTASITDISWLNSQVTKGSLHDIPVNPYWDKSTNKVYSSDFGCLEHQSLDVATT